MTDQNAQPTISLCSADPKSHFSIELSSAWKRGHFTDAAIAFLTEGGVEFFEQHCLIHQNTERCRLSLAVQWPTDLDAVSRLSKRLGQRLRIHLGARTPIESGTDVTPMLHSKVVYTDYGNGDCTAFVGSHNWTANALNGVNFEASIQIDCDINSKIAVDIREHLNRCAKGSVPFDPKDINYYKAVQRILSTAQPPAPDAEKLAVFETLSGKPAVIIHAEGDEARFVLDKVMLFLPVKQRSMAKWFSSTTPTTVFLFLYSPGTLFDHTPPSSRPILFQGPVGANNDVAVSPSRVTDVTCEIRNLSRPEVRDVPGRNIPPPANERYQVVAELRRIGPAVVPVYHRGKQPVLEIGVRFEEHRSGMASRTFHEDIQTEGLVGQYNDESMQNGVLVFKEPEQERVVHLDVPERWLYAEDVAELVRMRLSSPKSLEDGIRIALKPLKHASAYVYQASFVLYY